MSHPFKQSEVDVHTHYKISQALVEMLDKKCNLSSLLRLSVKKKIETYIRNTCGIEDINQSFRDWVKKKAI